jgi:predicted hydrocarbon binding protein
MPDFQIAPATLHILRRRLDLDGTAAAVLSEASVATGHALARRWNAHIEATTGLDRAADLDQRWFAPMLVDLLAGIGWGRVQLESLDDQALLIVHADSPEADPAGAPAPTCHFTAGTLATLLGDLAGAPVAVIEVDCLATGGPSCQFLAGSPELIGAARDLLTAGSEWREVLGGS